METRNEMVIHVVFSYMVKLFTSKDQPTSSDQHPARHAIWALRGMAADAVYRAVNKLII